MLLCAIVMLLVGQLLTDIDCTHAAPQAQQDIDCANNPFGGVIELGSEKEVFIRYPYEIAVGSALDLLKLDRFAIA